MVVISFQLEDNFIKDLDEITDNRSEFIRNLLMSKIQTVKEKSLNDLIVEAEECNNKLDILNNLITDKLTALRDKKQLENTEIEQKIKDKEEKQKQLYEQLSIILEPLDEIKQFEYINDWHSLPNLMPLLDKLLAKGVRIGVIQLREYLTMRKINLDKQ